MALAISSFQQQAKLQSARYPIFFSTYTEWTTNNILTAKDRKKKVYLLAACEEDTDAAICLDLNRIVRSISCRLYNSFSFLQGSINGSFCQRVFHTKYYGLLPILKNTAYSLIMCPCTKLDNNQDLMEISAHRLDKGTYCPAQS
jgi:hypothetical protein